MTSAKSSISQDAINEQRMMLYKESEKLREMVQRREPDSVKDYVLDGPSGEVTLSELFNGKDDLLVVHNMGSHCSYCTMWADSFVSQLPYIEKRAAFAVVSGDDPDQLKQTAEQRGWPFQLASDPSGDFTADMGFMHDDDRMPGVSAFHRNVDGSIERTGYDMFGPFDSYLGTWNLFALLHDGADNFQPG